MAASSLSNPSSVAVGAPLLLLLTTLVHASPDDYRVGDIYPLTVEIEIGGSANITCYMNPNVFPDKNASHMHFINEDTKERVPDSDIFIWNSTTIVYMLRNAPEQMSRFLCKCGMDAIMESSVYVGTPPRSVMNFGCRGYDFEYMICNFTQPENPVLTQYNVTLHLDSENYSYNPACNFNDKPLVVCNVTGDHVYRPIHNDYHFIVHSGNTLGSRTDNFNVDKLNAMVPARPGENLTIIHVTDSSIELQWRMPKFDFYSQKELLWEVLLQPLDFPMENWSTQVRVKRIRNIIMKLKLNALPYAFYTYELRVRVKVKTAPDSEDMWSAPLIFSFKTEARLPERPPHTDNGSFYVNSSETHVRLYWEQLEPQEYNGDNFTYAIRGSETWPNGTISQLQPEVLESNSSSAVFAWHRRSNYTYEIHSRNHVGESHAASRINIFSLMERKNYTPHSIHNVYHASNRTYTLTWEAPVETAGLLSYTVYWCFSKRALQTECKGSIHFQHVSRDTHRFITAPQSTEQEHTLNLAVSANYYNYNTGMHWTSCTMDVNSDLERMEPEIQDISATAIKVQWSSESVCPSILDGYNLTYCEVVIYSSTPAGSPNETAPCLNPPVTIDKNAKKYEINNLKPYTWYRVEMYMFSNRKVGKVSEPLVLRTAEAAPTQPRQLIVSDVTNTSATLSWQPPTQPNGLIRQYIVKSSKGDFPLNATAFDPTEKITFVMRNLVAHTAYKVYVIARTVENSNHSNDIHFTTRIGYPSMVTNVVLVSDNKRETVLKWSPPVVPSGRLDFYEVIMTESHKEDVIRRRISVVFNTSCVLRAPTCPDHDYKTVVEVRAVNVDALASRTNEHEIFTFDPDFVYYDGNDDLVCVGEGGINHNADLVDTYRNTKKYHLFKSAWQAGSTFGCAPRQLGRITLYTLLAVFSLLMLGTLTLICGRKYNTMSNIKCTMPAGLECIMKDGTAGSGVGCGIGNIGGGGHANDIMSSAAAIERSEQRIIVAPRLYKERNNEERHLLGNDSGYMGDGHTLGRSISAVDAAIAAASTTDDTYRRKHLHSESSADSLVGSTDSGDGEMEEQQHMTTQPNALQLKRIVEEDTSPYVQASMLTGVGNMESTCDSGYIKPTNLTAWSQQKSPPPAAAAVLSPTAAVNSGYVAIDSIPSAAKLNATAVPMPTSGYVQPSAFQKLMFPPPLYSDNTQPAAAANLSGYTSLDALGKLGMNATLTPNAMAQNVPTRQTALPGISGYVTQGELNAFGQQQQQQQQYFH